MGSPVSCARGVSAGVTHPGRRTPAKRAVYALTVAAATVSASGGCNGGGPAPARFPADLRILPGVEAACERGPDTESEFLVGVEEGVRRAIDSVVRQNGVAAIHLERHQCNVQVEVLRCSRPTGYDVAREPAAAPRIVSRPELLRDGNIAGGGALAARAETGADVVIETSDVDRWSVSWARDLDNVRWVSRFGPMVPAYAPTLRRAHLRGPDCARADAWVTAASYGTYRVRSGTAASPRDFQARAVDATNCQPPHCIEPIQIGFEWFRAEPCPPGKPIGSPDCVPLPSSFMDALPNIPRAPHGGVCMSAPRSGGTNRPGVIAGQMTEQAAQAKRLFEGQKWGDAMLALSRVANGETGDDEGNREVADYDVAVCWDRLGDEVSANAMMQAIARDPCHLMHDKASFWMAADERRRAF